MFRMAESSASEGRFSRRNLVGWSPSPILAGYTTGTNAGPPERTLTVGRSSHIMCEPDGTLALVDTADIGSSL